MSKGKSRGMRYLMKFSTAWNFLQAATWGDDYLESNISELIDPDADYYQLHQKNYLKAMKVGEVATVTLCCSVVELSHDFTKKMDRIQLEPFAKKYSHLVPAFKKDFLKFLVAEKQRQMNVESTALPEVPWAIQDIWSMPMVLWFRRSKNQ